MTEEIIKEEFNKAFKKNFPEAIIIDGVNVAGCKLYDYGICDSEMAEDLNCEKNPDCYYKQLKRLEQKYHEVLKLAKENADSNEYCLQELEQENKELKDRNIELQITLNEFDRFNKYRSALEEIEHGIMHIPPFDKQSAQMIEAILKLINEVLGND